MRLTRCAWQHAKTTARVPPNAGSGPHDAAPELPLTSPDRGISRASSDRHFEGAVTARLRRRYGYVRLSALSPVVDRRRGERRHAMTTAISIRPQFAFIDRSVIARAAARR
jgi:hypothetical protein